VGLSVETNLMQCKGCGTSFQTSKSSEPGFLPPKVFIKMQKAELEGGDDNYVVCQRCHNLTRKSTVSSQLTSQFGNTSTLSPQNFQRILSRIRDEKCVVIYLIDLFDFQGTFLNNLDEIVGSNPVVLAANKVDLLPKGANAAQTTRWIRREILRRKIRANIEQIYLISSSRGTEVETVFNNALQLAENGERDVYVIGAANVGKSSFVNRLLSLSRRGIQSTKIENKEIFPNKADSTQTPLSPDKEREFLQTMSLDLDDYLFDDAIETVDVDSFEGEDDVITETEIRELRTKWKDNEKRAISTSRLPGTTLDMIRIQMDGFAGSIYDTPGLIMPSQLTHRLTPIELDVVVPSKRISYQSVELKEGKALLIGGLATIQMETGKPFYVTLYLSKQIQIHPTRADNVDNFVSKHAGTLLTPPFDPQRFQDLRPFQDHRFRIRGIGFNHASVDIVISGLGWVSLTGSGLCDLKVSAPKGVSVFVRDPLMPHGYRKGKTAKFTGKRFAK